MAAPRKAWQCLATTALAALLLGATAAAMEPPAAVGAESDAAAKELDLLKSIARSPVKNEDFVVSVDGNPALGRKEAKLTLIEFSDLQCQFCRRHVNSVLPVLLERYVDTGQLRYVYFDFPAEAKHPHAQGAAVAARCAGEQNVLQQMRVRLYTSPDLLQHNQLLDHARALGLDVDAFSRCLADATKAEAVRQDLALGHKLMVRGTPTFLVGYRSGDGTQVRILRRIVGAQPIGVFEASINSVDLEAQKTAMK